MRDLFRVFEKLSSPSACQDGTDVYSTTPLVEVNDWHLGCNSEGQPAVLLSLGRSSGERRPLSVRLENLRIEHNVKCRIIDVGGESRLSRYSIIQCRSNLQDIQTCFLRVIASETLELRNDATEADLSSLVEHLLALFRFLSGPGSRTIQGLWAELFTISIARNPSSMVKAWHEEPDEKYDFCWNDIRLDVKSTSDRSRRHFVSLEQAYPPPGTHGIFVSLFACKQSGGLSLGDLWDQVLDSLEDLEDKLKVDRICIESLGGGIVEGRSAMFDKETARDSLMYYDANSIPKPSRTMPIGVSKVRFLSDFDFAKQLDFGEVNLKGQLSEWVGPA